eukprot:1974160-Rhodomonas_salina.2
MLLVSARVPVATVPGTATSEHWTSTPGYTVYTQSVSSRVPGYGYGPAAAWDTQVSRSPSRNL